VQANNNFSTIGHTPLRLGLGARRTTSCELEVVEMASKLLAAALPDAPQLDEMGMPSLLRDAYCPGADKMTTTAAAGDRQEGEYGSDGSALAPLARRAGAAHATTIALCLPACAAAVDHIIL
jgi:hypothetical protein